jgi:hypothetical protein
VIDDDDLEGADTDRWSDDEPIVPRRSNRGFWVVATALALSCVMLVIAIFANKPLKDSISHSEWSLRRALADAEQIRSSGEQFSAAGASALASSDARLTFVGPDVASTDPGTVSVYADASVWAATVAARPGACFSIKQVAGGDTRYGVSTDCTGRGALRANDTAW